jgi:hypothetical protein
MMLRCGSAACLGVVLVVLTSSCGGVRDGGTGDGDAGAGAEIDGGATDAAVGRDGGAPDGGRPDAGVRFDAAPDPADAGPCGQTGEQCCIMSDPPCTDEFAECVGGICEECGGVGQSCCEGPPECRVGVCLLDMCGLL